MSNCHGCALVALNSQEQLTESMIIESQDFQQEGLSKRRKVEPLQTTTSIMGSCSDFANSEEFIQSSHSQDQSEVLDHDSKPHSFPSIPLCADSSDIDSKPCNPFLALSSQPIIDTNKISNTQRHADSSDEKHINLFKDVSTNAATKEELLAERKKCQHEMFTPVGWEGDPWDENSPVPVDCEPAKTFNFPLDPFQRVSIACIERNESVLVSAHTSAGKTVVAQYAIASALRIQQRVIYTSPIKALSNQKYRDLLEEFSDVGLMTGDISINPEASCLVMTTEILRSMLYRGSEILREVGWVIFDEIHYMRDKERGVVWEETLILLPSTIRFAFLSATIPNAREFANWIVSLHLQPCHVVYTDFRPIPLQHYIYPAGSTSLHLVVDERGRFLEENFQKALAGLSAEGQGDRKGNKFANDAIQIVQVIMERNYEPVIVFSFSKKTCELLATKLLCDYNSQDERKMVTQIFMNAIDTLSQEDKKLPQVSSILPLLQRGVGIHHSGLLPLLKEVIEILFQEGLIKCLFATETFSIGLNMPAKTVVFTSMRKFDGTNFRWVSGGEYIQMSGRAGRRGIDERGIVVMMVDEKMDPSIAKEMVKGQSDVLNSSFHVGYNMLLNTIRVANMDPEIMLKASFHQFQHQQQYPVLKAEIDQIEKQLNSIRIENEEVISTYYQLNMQAIKLRSAIHSYIVQPEYILPFLLPGRLVKIVNNTVNWGWGIVVNYQKLAIPKEDSTPKRNQSKGSNRNKVQTSEIENDDLVSNSYVVDILLACSSKSNWKAPPNRGLIMTKDGNSNDSSSKITKNGIPLPALPGQTPEFLVVPVMLNLIESISQIKILLPRDLRQPESRETVWKTLLEVKRRFNDQLPMLDPVEDMDIVDESFIQDLARLEEIEQRLLENECHLKRAIDPMINQSYEKYCDKVNLQEKLKEQKKQIRLYDQVILADDLKAMKRVLRRLSYISQDNIIEMKGRVACEINAADELVLTELIFSGFFNNLTIAQIVAMLSCFVFQEKADDVKKLPDVLGIPFREMLQVVKRVAEVEQECKLPTDPVDYVNKFKPSLLEVTYAWANGSSFYEVCKLTNVFEGSIIRAMRRLEELLRQLINAAKSIGNTELENNFSNSVVSIKRDIVFAASLYL